MIMKQDLSGFTTEELDLLTVFNCYAYMLHKVNAKINGSIPPCWLTMNNKARDRIRQAFFLAYKTDAYSNLVEFENSLNGSCTPEMMIFVAYWRMVELEAKQARDAGDPLAFFSR